MAVTTLALDTSAYSNLRRGHPAVIDHIAEAETVIIPAVVVGELHAGFSLGSRRAENVHVLDEFIAELFVQVVPITANVAQRYGDWFATLRKAGTPVPTNDIWVAACAQEASAALLTFDHDFKHFGGLQLMLLE